MLVAIGFLAATVWGIVITRAGFVALGRGQGALLGPDALLVTLMVLFLGFAGGAAYGYLVVWPRVLAPVQGTAADGASAAGGRDAHALTGQTSTPPAAGRTNQPAQTAKPSPSTHVEPVPQAAVAGGVEIYQSTLMHIWADGVVTEKEQTTLADLRQRLGVSDPDHAALEKEVQEVLFPDGLPTNRSIYRATLEQIWADGVVTAKEQRVLEELRRHLAVSEEIHADLEVQVRAEAVPGPDAEDGP